jgi:exosortase/archaeosortase family protein
MEIAQAGNGQVCRMSLSPAIELPHTATTAGNAQTVKFSGLDARLHNLVLLAIQFIAFWPVWEWYVGRMLQFPENRPGLLALATAVGVIMFAPRGAAERAGILLPAICALLQAFTVRFVHPMVGSILAALSIGYTASCFVPRQRRLPLVGLMLLSLPVIPSMMTYLGYPLRVSIAQVAAPWARLAGFVDTVAEGVGLRWSNGLLLVDEPCSGIRMLWAGYYLAFVLAELCALRSIDTILLSGATLVAVFIANLFRALTLYFIQVVAGGVEVGLHAMIGLFCFAAGGAAVLFAAVYLQERRRLIHPGTSPAVGRGIQTTRHHAMNVTGPAFLLASFAAALIPALPMARTSSMPSSFGMSFPGWPTEFGGKALRPEKLQPREERYYRDFAGRIAKFTDGKRQIIIRWLPENLGDFHMTQRCFRALGYELHAQPAWRDEHGQFWSTFHAIGTHESLVVHERILDTRGHAWTDESAWRWDVLWRKTGGPWWAYTIAQKP